MKVKVFVKTAPMTKHEKYLHDIIDELHADLEAALSAQEQTFQEKRDAERAQVCAERDLKALKTKFADVCAERDNMTAAYKQLGATVIELQKKLHDNEERACDAYTALFDKSRLEREELESEIGDLRDELNDRNARIDELERQIEWLRDKNDEWAQVAAAQKKEKKALENIIHTFEETRKEYEEEIHTQHVEKREWMKRYEDLKAQKEADDKKSEEICTACNERYEDVLSERNRLREEVARLTTERDTAIKENSDLIFQMNALDDELTAAVNLKNEYAEHASELRKQLNIRDNSTRNFWNFLVEYNIVKSKDEMGGITNGTE